MFTESTIQQFERAVGKAHPDPDALLHQRVNFVCDEIKALKARKQGTDEELLEWFCDWMSREGLSFGYVDSSGQRDVYKRHPDYIPLFPAKVISVFLDWLDGYYSDRVKRRSALRANNTALRRAIKEIDAQYTRLNMVIHTGLRDAIKRAAALVKEGG